MFGEGYHRVESIPTIEAGHYNARITAVRMTQGALGQQIEVTVSVEGHPNFWLGDSPKSGNAQYSLDELLDFWCKRMTSFFDSFGIKAGDFNIAAWQGRVGRITVRPQKSKPQYMEIVPYETSFDSQKKEAPQPQQSWENAARQMPSYAPQQVPPQQNVPQYSQNRQYQPSQQSFGSEMEGFPNEVPF